MTDLLAARSQMAMSLAFHIVFAVVGGEYVNIRPFEPLWNPVRLCLA